MLPSYANLVLCRQPVYQKELKSAFLSQPSTSFPFFCDVLYVDAFFGLVKGIYGVASYEILTFGGL